MFRYPKKISQSKLFYDNGAGYVQQYNDTVQEFYSNLSYSNMQNTATTTAHLYTLLARMFEKIIIICGTMCNQTDGCEKKYRCYIAYYLIYFLSKSHKIVRDKAYQIVLDRSVYTPGNGKDVVDGFNSVQKQYLATCLRICITPEVDNIDSKRMRVYSMTEKGEVSFAE